MTVEFIRNLRLGNQLLTNNTFTKTQEIVSHFGAMQAQDYAMAKWAIGSRLGTDEKTIDNAINNAEIIRTHILRPTWHFVAAEDIHWMLELTAPQIKTLVINGCRKLGIDDPTLHRCHTIIEKLLVGNNHLTREEIMNELAKSKIATDPLSASHIMMDAELEGIVCNGNMRGKQFTYALLDERVKKTKSFAKEEALAQLAKKYFTSHGPATLQDFAWWSGLSVGNSKKALESIKLEMESFVFEAGEYWFYGDASNVKRQKMVHLLPSFDEFLISYKNRTASILLEHQPKAFTRNGIFNPVILVDGKVEGSWKRTIKKETVLIELNPFIEFDEKLMQKIIKVSEVYENFLGKKSEIIVVEF